MVNNVKTQYLRPKNQSVKSHLKRANEISNYVPKTLLDHRDHSIGSFSRIIKVLVK